MLAALPLLAADLPTCMRYGAWRDALSSMGEALLVQLVDERGTTFEIYLHPDTGRWSMLQVNTDKMTCIRSHGTGYVTPLGNGGDIL